MSNDDVRMSDPNRTTPDPVALGGTPVGDAPATAGTQPEELRRYPVSREDLLVIAKQRYKDRLDTEMRTFFAGGNDEEVQGAYSRAPLARIEHLLDAGSVQQIFEELADEHRSIFGSERWSTFACSDTAERDRLLASDRADHRRLSRKLGDPASSGKASSFLREHPTRVVLDGDGDLWYLTEPPQAEEPGLLLKLAAPSGHAICAPGIVFDLPAGWSRPFGLR
jgi:hypothetical protein